MELFTFSNCERQRKSNVPIAIAIAVCERSFKRSRLCKYLPFLSHRVNVVYIDRQGKRHNIRAKVKRSRLCKYLPFLSHRVNVVYIDRQGKRHNIRAKVGDNVMYLAHRYNIELEGTL